MPLPAEPGLGRGGVDGAGSAAMEALNCYVDLGTRRLTTIPQEQADGLDRVIAEAAALPWQPMLSGTITPR